GANKLYEYKPTENKWLDLGKGGAGSQRAWSYSFTIGSKAYVCGGSVDGGSNLAKDLYEFDATTNAWTKKANMPAVRDAGFAFAVGGKGYVGCGFDGSNVVNNFYQYDPVADKWTELKGFDQSLIFPSSFVINDTAYVIGGADFMSMESMVLYRYNPSSDSWVTLEDFPGDLRQAATAFVLNYEGYYCGGMSQYTTTYKDMWKFSPATGHWSKVNFELPTDYTVWQSAVSTGPWVSEHPNYVMFIAGAGFFKSPFTGEDTLEVSSRSFIFNPQTASVSNAQISSEQVFPNPVESGSSITVSSAMSGEYSIYDALGRVVSEGNYSGGQISTAGIATGYYTLEVTELFSQAKKKYRISIR
ncbi:MAG TPA: T9SS type A sorting domain-containing protein, partial [Candidatus Kapabacteria bacterium]|nr:T9SS type A sorting domain-containing protein [Candidatus Kapabacteria bacterium]